MVIAATYATVNESRLHSNINWGEALFFNDLHQYAIPYSCASPAQDDSGALA
jgi:hypothetical protein